MSGFFAMNVPTTDDIGGYLLRLPQLLPVYLIPLICFYGVLAVWVIRKLRQKPTGVALPGPAPSEPGWGANPDPPEWNPS